MQRFTIPRDVYFGDGAIEQLGQLRANKAMIVIGSERLIKDGTVEKVQSLLSQQAIESQLFQGVENDPTVETVMKGSQAMAAYEPDLIIGIGGGSPIDAAKAMWIFYEQPDFTFEAAATPFNLPELRKKARFVAIPTTSGTGTEVTSFSVIADETTDIKYPIADFNITPDVAIIDTQMVESLTPNLVANTGMDALTHAFEAYVSTVSNPITDALAMKSIEMIQDNLLNSYKGEEGARKTMHLAQAMAGMSFSNAILGIVHSMAHKTGRIFQVPHGMANAIYLPYVIAYNAKEAPSKYVDIAKRLGLEGSNDQAYVSALIQFVKDLQTAMNMPATLQDYGVTETLFLDNLDLIAENAVADACTGTNPRSITVDQMKQLFEATYYGKEITF